MEKKKKKPKQKSNYRKTFLVAGYRHRQKVMKLVKFSNMRGSPWLNS